MVAFVGVVANLVEHGAWQPEHGWSPFSLLRYSSFFSAVFFRFFLPVVLCLVCTGTQQATSVVAQRREPSTAYSHTRFPGHWFESPRFLFYWWRIIDHRSFSEPLPRCFDPYTCIMVVGPVSADRALPSTSFNGQQAVRTMYG